MIEKGSSAFPCRDVTETGSKTSLSSYSLNAFARPEK
jgi:hypothetical protein